RKGFVLQNCEFTEHPICLASRTYQTLKLEQLRERNPQVEPSAAEIDRVTTKACICHDLAGCATLSHGIDPNATPAVCCGPNIAWFDRVASLEEMVGHIYGRLSLLTQTERPHMFINELQLYVAELRRQTGVSQQELSTRLATYIGEFRANLLQGVEHYRSYTARFLEDAKARFLADLDGLEKEIRGLGVGAAVPA
ncbi:MAG: hypothetical protein IT440_16360, partial [Phycisphaeraceae bacterium]|nr:hypothetical protein [Phycisphaeraceae bacterium]